MKRGPLFVALGVAVLVPAALSCTHTVEGTGGPGSATTPTTSGTSPAPSCTNIAGNWEVNGVGARSCAQDACIITQQGCDVVLDCVAGMLDGTVDDTTVHWSGQGGASCTGAVGPAGAHLDGACNGPDGNCTISAAKSP